MTVMVLGDIAVAMTLVGGVAGTVKRTIVIIVSFPDPALPTEEGLVLFEQFLGLFSSARSADLDMLPSNTTSRGLVISGNSWFSHSRES